MVIAPKHQAYLVLFKCSNYGIKLIGMFRILLQGLHRYLSLFLSFRRSLSHNLVGRTLLAETDLTWCIETYFLPIGPHTIIIWVTDVRKLSWNMSEKKKHEKPDNQNKPPCESNWCGREQKEPVANIHHSWLELWSTVFPPSMKFKGF